MKCSIAIYEYIIKNGGFDLLIRDNLYEVDANTSAKELFEFMMTGLNKSNKFFIMQVKYSDKVLQFYTIRTNVKESVECISMIGPNTLDKDMLIHAIIGCKPTLKFMDSCSDRIIKKALSYSVVDSEGKMNWPPDIKDRLEKVNHLRLKEIYEKLRANQ